jgi:hypothetical protein
VSFAERHKRWLLPLLGIALAGVVWLNLPARTPAAAPGPKVPAPASPESASGSAGAPSPDQTEAREPGPSGPAPEPPALGTASLEDNDTLPLLLAGRQPVIGTLRNGPRPPVLHPDQWAGLAQGPQPAAASASASAVDRPAPTPATAPRTLDFTLESATRQEVWVGGRGYRPGDTLPGGYRLRRLTPDGALLAGPDGERRMSLGAAPGPPPSASLPGDPP